MLQVNKAENSMSRKGYQKLLGEGKIQAGPCRID